MQHADAGEREAGPPAEPVGEDRAEQLPDDRADVDAHVEDREAGIAAAVALLVERSDDGRDVRLEEAVADRDQRQGDRAGSRAVADCARRRDSKAPFGNVPRDAAVGREQRDAAVVIAAGSAASLPWSTMIAHFVRSLVGRSTEIVDLRPRSAGRR